MAPVFTLLAEKAVYDTVQAAQVRVLQLGIAFQDSPKHVYPASPQPPSPKPKPLSCNLLRRESTVPWPVAVQTGSTGALDFKCHVYFGTYAYVCCEMRRYHAEEGQWSR